MNLSKKMQKRQTESRINAVTNFMKDEIDEIDAIKNGDGENVCETPTEAKTVLKTEI